MTALAAMQEHLLTPFTPLHCTPTYVAYGQTFNNWTPTIDQWMDLRDRARRVVRHVLLPARRRLLRAAAEPRPPAAGLGERASGSASTTGIDIGGETQGLIPTPEWRCKHFGGPPCQGYVDRIWKPGYSIQLAIGQGDLLVTPLQMARFYALIANGGKLVTPHLAEDVEQSGSDGQPLRVLRRFGAQPPQPVERRPDRAAVRPASGSTRRRTRRSERRPACSGTSSVDIAGKTGSAEKFVHAAGLPNPHQAEPVVVVRLRAVRRADDRRLRGDRERRPRRHRGGAGGAEGLRAVLPHDRDHDAEGDRD